MRDLSPGARAQERQSLHGWGNTASARTRGDTLRHFDSHLRATTSAASGGFCLIRLYSRPCPARQRRAGRSRSPDQWKGTSSALNARSPQNRLSQLAQVPEGKIFADTFGARMVQKAL